MRTRLLILGLVTSLSGAGGCGTLFKQAYHSVRGAQGKYYEIAVVDSEVLATYKSIRVEPFTNELGDRVPSAVISEVNSDTPTQIEEKHLFYPVGKQLIVTGRVIHFTGSPKPWQSKFPKHALAYRYWAEYSGEFSGTQLLWARLWILINTPRRLVFKAMQSMKRGGTA